MIRTGLPASVAILVLGTLVGCGESEEKRQERAIELRDSYFEALCPIYVDETCETALIDECGVAVTFDTTADCMTFLKFAAAGCAGLTDSLLELEDDVNACIAEVDAFECGVDEGICDIGTTGACAPVDAAFEAACPDE